MKKAIWESGMGFVFLFAFTLTAQVRATEYFVTIYNSFSPSHLEIQFGDTVTWINQDPFFSHTVHSSTGAWTTGYLFEEDDTFSLTFNAIGNFAYYDDGSFANGSITVTGGNTPPSIAITNLTDGASFTAPATVLIEAEASDPDGSVANVEFFVDATSIGNSSSSPYSATASNLFEGNYIISAVVTDDLGATTSHSISISVTNPIISVSAPKMVNGEFQFNIAGLVAGKTNLIQVSTNLADWASVRTNLATSSFSTFTNTQTAGSNLRFYQVIQLP